MFEDDICPQCGRKFHMTDKAQWCYRFYDSRTTKYLLYCGWTCLRAAEKKREANKKKRSDDNDQT